MKNRWEILFVIGAIGTISIAILGLVGYFPGMELLGSIKNNYIPMAPSTAICFIVIGCILLLFKFIHFSRTKSIIFFIFALSVSLFGILEVIGNYVGIDLNFEESIVPAVGNLNGIPIARMSPATGAAFFLSGLVVLLLIIQRKFTKQNKLIEYVKGGLGILVLLISFVFCLAYLYGTPLLYELDTTIPMALTTALGFMFISISFLTFEKDAFPLWLLTETSTRSYLLRFIFPFSILSVILGGVVTIFSEQMPKINPAFMSATLTILIAIFAGFVATLISRHIGVTIDSQKATIKQTGQELHRIKILLESSIESPKDMIIISLNSQYQYLYFNKTHAESVMHVYGTRPQIEECIFDYMRGKDDIEKSKEHYDRALAGEGHVAIEEYGEYQTRSFYETRYNPIYDESNKIFGVTAFSQDITDRKLVELALSAEKERLAVTLRSIGDGVITTDTNGNIVMLNKVAEKMTGWSQKEAFKKDIKKVFNIIHATTRQQCENPIEKVLVTKTIVELANHTTLIARDGTERIIADSGAPIFDSNSEIIGVVLVFRDVTEKYKIEKRLQQSQKMEAIGTLAGGIAHDFNNMLGVITGNISYALSNLNKNDELFELLSEVQESSKQAQSLTHQLLTFSKGGAPIKKVTDINKLIKESTTFSIRGAKSSCSFDFADNLWPAEVDEGQINQVIGNLMINANQSMPNGGTIAVRTENTEISAESGLSVPAGRYIKIVIEDQGVGISKKHLSNIFEPYFTTKQKGSGLGLATAYSIITRHDGHISVYSEIEKGAVFNIYLPASLNDIIESKGKEEHKHSGKGKILIMDDQESILNMAGRMLNKMGYETEFALDGNEAIKKYREGFHVQKPFDLVILDLTIPGGMGGTKTIIELLKIDPNVKAIVSSGYSNDPCMANYEDYGFCGVVPKPYTMDQLSEVFNRIFC